MAVRGTAGVKALIVAALAALAVPAASGSTQSVEPPIPVEAFGDLPFIGEPMLSPNGTKVAARVFDGGKERVGIWDSDSGVTPRRLISAGDYDLKWFRWAGDDRLLIGVQSIVVVYGLPVPVSRVMAYDLEAN